MDLDPIVDPSGLERHGRPSTMGRPTQGRPLVGVEEMVGGPRYAETGASDRRLR